MKPINVTAAIIEKGGKFLIAKRKEGKHLAGKWEFPGGKIEKGETPEKCLRRELKEEFGIAVQVENFVGKSIFDYDGKIIRLLGYRAKYISGKFQLNAHDEIKWIAIDEFADYDFAPADLPLIEKITSEEK